MPEPLTEQERDVLDYLVDYVRAHTYQPSIREIGTEFDIRSTKTVSELLQSLADKGWIERDPSRSRGVRLLGLKLDADVVSVPHVDVHLTETSLRDSLDHLTLDRRLVGSSACFMVSMVGNSMRDAGIWDGDLLLVEPVSRKDVDDGDLVAARIDGESTIRRYVYHGADVMLQAGQLDIPPVLLSGPASVEILGRVVAVIRRLRTDARAGVVEGEHSSEGAIAR